MYFNPACLFYVFRPDQKDFIEDGLDNQQRSLSHCKFTLLVLSQIYHLIDKLSSFLDYVWVYCMKIALFKINPCHGKRRLNTSPQCIILLPHNPGF